MMGANPLLFNVSNNVQGGIINLVLEELRKQFGNAEVEDRGGSKVIVVRIDKETLRRFVFKGLDPQLASVTDVDIKDGAIELVIRVV